MVDIRKNEKVLNKRNNCVLSAVESIRKNREIIKVIYDTPAIKMLNKSNDSVLSMVESITKNREIIKVIYDNPLIKVLNKTNGGFVLVSKSIAKIKPQLEELKINDIFVNNDGTINYSNNLMSLEETVDSMIPYIEEDISIEHKINNSIEDFKKNNPLKYKAIVFIIGFFIMGLAQAYYNEIGLKLINTKIGSYKEIQSNTKIINKKEIKKEVKEELDNKVQDKNLKEQLLNDYRFVTVDCLNVRYTAAKKSNIIYQLNFGQVVRIIYKNKN
ncbi:hypothetical protein [Clostridium tetani]|uniref:hypothetical protein n=1 Tax=Clostridium tetani TaxID=1513 RepID=UPI0010260892|nr:hypothetical protein [Clostridium tetani]RXI67518.1 hypothetical protein DP127_14190 [Clostridium tetani]